MNPMRGSLTWRCRSSPIVWRIVSPIFCVRLVTIEITPRVHDASGVDDFHPAVVGNEALDLVQHLLGVKSRLRDARDSDGRALPQVLVINLCDGHVELRAEPAGDALHDVPLG